MIFNLYCFRGCGRGILKTNNNKTRILFEIKKQIWRRSLEKFCQSRQELLKMTTMKRKMKHSLGGSYLKLVYLTSVILLS